MTDEEFDNVLGSIAEITHSTYLTYKYKSLIKLIRIKALNGEPTEQSRKILQMSDFQIALLLENGEANNWEMPE